MNEKKGKLSLQISSKGTSYAGSQVLPFWKGVSVGKEFKKKLGTAFFVWILCPIMFGGKADGLWSPHFRPPQFAPRWHAPDPKGSSPPKNRCLAGTSFYVNFLLSEEPPVFVTGALGCIRYVPEWKAIFVQFNETMVPWWRCLRCKELQKVSVPEDKWVFFFHSRVCRS